LLAGQFERYAKLSFDQQGRAKDAVGIPCSLHTLSNVNGLKGTGFEYRAKVDNAKHSHAGRFAYDVFLKKAP
jgi:hypothetical protein